MELINNFFRVETLTSTLSIIFWFIVILIPLVAIHEFGHLLISKLFGVRIPEYGIGMPLSKRQIWFRWKGTVWSFYPWLLGGFVRIYGEHDALDDAWETNKTDPAKAKAEYVPARLNEIMQNQELQFFLEENSLEMDERWRWFERIYLKQNQAFNGSVVSLLTNDLGTGSALFVGTALAGLAINEARTKIQNLNNEESLKLKQELKSKFDNLASQLETLVQWEFEGKFNPKNTKAFKNAFFAKNWIQQTLIIAGGVIFNMITAFVLLMILFGITGSPIQGSATPILYNQVEEFRTQPGQVNLVTENLTLIGVVKDSAADKAGLKAGDEIIQLGNDQTQRIRTNEDFVNIVQNYKDKTVEVIYKSKGETSNKTTNITPQTNAESGKARLGVSVGYLVQRRAGNPIEAFSMAWNETGRIFSLTVEGIQKIGVALLPQTQDRSALDNTGGPIAVGRIGGIIFDLQGIQGVIYLMAAISVSLAIFNMLPIPALDGGRFILLTISKIAGKRNKQVEAMAISITFFVLMALAVVIAGNDIRRIVQGLI